MERIQIALEKARARRAAQTAQASVADKPAPGFEGGARASAPGNAPLPANSQADGPTASPGTPAPVDGSLLDAAELGRHWLALPEFHPDPSIMMAHRVTAFSGGTEASAIDIMRTKILHEMRVNGWKRLAVTSPNPGCGKTTTCANLGFSLSRQRHRRTVVLDFDLRRPGLARLLGLRKPRSIAHMIEGTDTPEQHLVRYGPNLAFGTQARPVPQSAELLGGAGIGPALSRIEADYAPDAIIFDLPPMFSTDDVMAFAPHVHCVLILAAAEQTRIDDLDRAERELSQVTNVLGVVLNKCRYSAEEYGYGY